MKGKTKWVLLATVLVLAAASVFVLKLGREDRLRASARREWKENAIPKVAHRITETVWITNQIATLTARIAAHPDDAFNWIGDEMLVMKNGDWIVYSAKCSKADSRIHDIFIGRASDGKWYYSTYHFCISMSALSFEPQPSDLTKFVSICALREFDGRSDECLKLTWPAPKK